MVLTKDILVQSVKGVLVHFVLKPIFFQKLIAFYDIFKISRDPKLDMPLTALFQPKSAKMAYLVNR